MDNQVGGYMDNQVMDYENNQIEGNIGTFDNRVTCYLNNKTKGYSDYHVMANLDNWLMKNQVTWN